MAVLVAMAIVAFAIFVVALAISVLARVATMFFLVTRDVFVLVPGVLHKIDTLATGVVLAAMFAPVFCVTRGNMQVDRRAEHRSPLDEHRFGVDEAWRRKAADVDLTIKTGLADADGHADVSRVYWNGDGQGCCEK